MSPAVVLVVFGAVMFGAAVASFFGAVVAGMVTYLRSGGPEKRSRVGDALAVLSAWLLLGGVAWLTAAALVASVSSLVGAVLS